MENMVALLVSKKRCIISKEGVFLKKGAIKKNAIIKLRGLVVPNEINTNLYHSIFVNKKDAEKIPFYN